MCVIWVKSIVMNGAFLQTERVSNFFVNRLCLIQLCAKCGINSSCNNNVFFFFQWIDCLVVLTVLNKIHT